MKKCICCNDCCVEVNGNCVGCIWIFIKKVEVVLVLGDKGVVIIVFVVV